MQAGNISSNINLLSHVNYSHFLALMPDDGLGVQEGDTLEFEEGVVDGVSNEVPHPLGHHDGAHDGQQELHVVSDLNLKVGKRSILFILSLI